MAVAAAHPAISGHEDHIHPEPESFVAKYIFSIDAKVIGVQYMITGLLFFIISGLLAEVVRIQLLRPEGGFVSNDTYNGVYSLHGTAMVWMDDHSARHRRLRQLRDAAADRRARRRVPVAQPA
jgi:uncharacterized membrane protein YhfC